MTHEPDDEQHWLDLMAGRAAPEADTRTRKEAAWLRAALLSYRVQAPPGAPADADERVVRLLTRAREGGVLMKPAANDAVLPHRFAWRWRYAMAACVAVFGVLLVSLPQRQEEGSTLRGAPVQSIQAQDALQRRQQMLRDLRAAGFDAQPFERLGRPSIDVSLPVPLPPEQAAALKHQGLVPPDGPSLQIEFVIAKPAKP